MVEPALRFALAVAIGTVGGALFLAVDAPLPWVLGSMAGCVIASIVGLPVAASSATRQTMAAVVGVALEPGVVVIHHLARVIMVLVAAPVFFRTNPEEPQSS